MNRLSTKQAKQIQSEIDLPDKSDDFSTLIQITYK